MVLVSETGLKPGTSAFLSQPKQLLIGGEWVDAANGETFETVNPATGQVLVKVAAAGAEDVNRAVDAARKAFESNAWSGLSGTERGNLLWKIADLIEKYTDELAELETLDNGKPLKTSSRVDVPQAVRHFRYYAGWASKIEGSTIPVSFPNQLVYTLREPMVVVGLI